MNPHLLALGFTLLHFCWQATLIAGLYKTAEILLPGLKPSRRYEMALGAMLAILVVAVVTFVYEDIRLGREVVISVAQLTDRSSPGTSLENDDISLHRLLPWLDMAWLVGVLCLTLRMAGGLWQIHSLSRTATAVPEALLQRFAEAVKTIGLSKRVQVRLHPGITGPFVVGVIRAVVYLPFSAITHLSPSQLEAILAHELEHIRRFDYLWNLIQTLVETLFFYHPAVWWLGRVLREQRELCCDDAALGTCTDPLTYATALLRLEEQRPRKIALRGLVMALNGQGEGAGLLSRITRMLGEAPAKSASGRYNPMVAVPLILLSLSGFVAPATKVVASTPVVKAIAATLPVPMPPVAPPEESEKPAKGVKTVHTIHIEKGRVVSDMIESARSSDTTKNTTRTVTVIDGRVVDDKVVELSEAQQAKIEAQREADQEADAARREADQQIRQADQERRQAQREIEREAERGGRQDQAEVERERRQRDLERAAERAGREAQIRAKAQFRAEQQLHNAQINAENQRVQAEIMSRAAEKLAAKARDMAVRAEEMRAAATRVISAPPLPSVPPVPSVPAPPPVPPVSAVPPVPPVPAVPDTPAKPYGVSYRTDSYVGYKNAEKNVRSMTNVKVGMKVDVQTKINVMVDARLRAGSIPNPNPNPSPKLNPDPDPRHDPNPNPQLNP